MRTYNPQNTTAKQLLSERSLLYIPKFQRGYEWDSDNWEELWEDFSSVVSNPGSEHFVGVVIFAELSSGDDRFIAGSNVKQYEVIDGQQRLTTFTIFQKAVIDTLQDLGEANLAAKFFDDYVTYSREGKLRISLGEIDNDFFKAHIQKFDIPNKKTAQPKSHRRLIKAYWFFRDRLEEYLKDVPDSKKAETLKYLADDDLDRMLLLSITVSSDIDAYAIFESINSKKQDLKAADLIKNYVFSIIDKSGRPRQLEEVQQGWTEMLKDFNENDPSIETSQFIRHYWLSRYEDRATDKSLYRDIKKRFSDNAADILAFLEKLNSEYSLYSKLLSSSEEEVGDIDLSSVRDINDLKIKQCYPLLLACVAEGLPNSAFTKIVNAITSVSLRRGIVGRNPNELELFYSTEARQVRSSGSAYDVSSFIGGIKKYSIDDDSFKAALLQQDPAKYQAKFMLLRMEQELETGEKPINSQATIEHILPERPRSLTDWKMTSAEHLAYYAKIGNLTLVGKKFNTTMSNKAFTEKKKELKQSDIQIASQISQNSHWGVKEIEARSQEIGEWAAQKWPDIS